VGASESVAATSLSAEEATAAATERLTGVLATLAGRLPEHTESGSRPDVRRALRSSVATGGVLTSVPELQRRRSEVRGVVFADVSRSMLDVLDRSFLVGFLRAVHQSWRSARSFIFDTDVRDVTDALDAETADATFTALEDAEAAWGGGTRIGHAIESVRRTDPDVVDRRTVAVVLSDGLEMGDLDELESGMAWLARRASLVVWLNPSRSRGVRADGGRNGDGTSVYRLSLPVRRSRGRRRTRTRTTALPAPAGRCSGGFRLLNACVGNTWATGGVCDPRNQSLGHPLK